MNEISISQKMIADRRCCIGNAANSWLPKSITSQIREKYDYK